MKTVMLPFVLGLVLLKNCDHGVPQCVITPPESLKDKSTVAVKAAADLTKYTALPISANASVNIQKDFEEVYAKVPDKLAGCQMVLQTILCLREHSDPDSTKLAQDLTKYVTDKNICTAEFKQLLNLQ